jgi:hypothetical protein
MAAHELDIELIQGTERARWAATVLKRYHRDTDLDRLLRTRRIRIDDQLGGGYSHPVLTLGLGLADCDERLLSLLLHEQMHWHLCDCEPQLDAAIEVFKRLWPAPQIDAAADLYSTYLHMAVNWLEVSALADILGPERATEIFAGHRHYRWINGHVLNNLVPLQEIMSVNKVGLPAQHRWS